ncbi:hypothetical protein EH221_08550 [bacterium]|nr:MAG: hypothetical protein EH221_08550 [bacterium]
MRCVTNLFWRKGIKYIIISLTCLFCFFGFPIFASETTISPNAVPSDLDLLQNLKSDIPALTEIYRLRDMGKTEQAIKLLVEYLKQKSADRFYFDWKYFKQRFNQYRKQYPEMRQEHFDLSSEQMTTFPPETNWILPFKNLRGKEVTAYELRHLARQQKSYDMALIYYYLNEDDKYLDYWVRQVADLNRAFSEGAYDDAGNGVYESFRAGKRIHNWLFCHNAYLASNKFHWQSQLLLIKTFLHHGAQLQQETQKYRSGNHHTKGLVALFEIAALFSDFRILDSWVNQALNGLAQHLQNEVNRDGFQSERSVHYHIGDIENYFRVYQLAKLNQIELPAIFENQFRKMFEALAHLAQPNRRLPVLQDDTDSPFAENNQIDDAMTIGALVFGDPIFRYFAADEIPASIYWLLRPSQFDNILKMKGEKPKFGSIALTETGYYCMRNGWDKNDLYLTISAGISKMKPDHQHGDMLGIVAYVNGHEILPNYQVKYKEADFPFWKNSWVKNVALVDSIPLGQGWLPNEGGSGFGKWANLPQLNVIKWETTETFDYFLGTHNGYDSLGVKHFREVLFVKDGFWIVRDHFQGEEPHEYQQVWQGHYSIKDNNHVFSTFDDGTGLQIIQLIAEIDQVSLGKFRSKANMVFNRNDQKDFVFTTLLLPFSEDSKIEIDNFQTQGEIALGNWKILKNDRQEILLIDAVKNTQKFSIKGKDFISCLETHCDIDSLIIQNISFAQKQYSMMLEKLGDTNRNPRTTNEDGSIKLVPSKDWTSGFFPRCLWLLYEFSQKEKWESAARKFTATLEQEKFNAGTHDMGFKMFCSFGNGFSLTQDQKYKEILLQSARTLITRFNSKVGCIRSWDHHQDVWQYPVIIDNMMNLELLFWATKMSGDSTFYRIAVTHANTTLKNHFRENNSCWHVVNYDTTTGQVINKQTHQGHSHDSAWARGHAWALYGYTMCYRETKDERYLIQAQKIAETILNHKNLPGDMIPYWDFDAPNIPNEERDASAGAIMCSALYELSELSGESDLKYRKAADKILQSLSSPTYRATVGENNHFLLKHSVGSKPGKFEIDVPLIYADYYFLEANLRRLRIER